MRFEFYIFFFYSLISFKIFFSISIQNLSENFHKQIKIQTEFKFKKLIIQIFQAN